MTVDQAAALSLLEDLPRTGLTARLQASDPELLETAARSAARASAVRDKAERRGIQFTPWNDARFPPALLATSDCPPGLWSRGSLGCLARTVVAIVGSRSGSSVALETAARLSEELAGRGVTVVSGLARGVDSAAHRGALRAGVTAAVLGSGLEHLYPAEHAGLADDIAAAGAVITEYAPWTPPLRFNFPMRNRIISGLSRAVVVIEASERSGSLITAACALEQGREVMAVPGNVLSGRNRGGHGLIRDGAKIVECADDILSELGFGSGVDRKSSDESSGCGQRPSGDPLLSRMEPGQAYDLDALAALAGVSAVRLIPRLCELELDGSVRRAGGGRFMRASRTC
jgi:DNA processing protein